MAQQPYREVSVEGQGLGTGFRFEFRCQGCDQRWQSPVRRYRVGQFTSLVLRAAHFARISLPGSWVVERASAAATPAVHEAALDEAQQLARDYFRHCSACQRHLCSVCFGPADLCAACLGTAALSRAPSVETPPARQGVACPACEARSDGGRFCPECGFDLAATHKACPACSAQWPRQALFCGDCGHAF